MYVQQMLQKQFSWDEIHVARIWNFQPNRDKAQPYYVTISKMFFTYSFYKLRLVEEWAKFYPKKVNNWRKKYYPDVLSKKFFIQKIYAT